MIKAGVVLRMLSIDPGLVIPSADPASGEEAKGGGAGAHAEVVAGKSVLKAFFCKLVVIKGDAVFLVKADRGEIERLVNGFVVSETSASSFTNIF